MNRTLVVIGLAVALALLTLSFQRCGQRGAGNAPKVPADVQRVLDSLSVTAASAQKRADSLLRLVGRDTARVRVIQYRVDTLLVSLQNIESIADSLASVGKYEAAYRAARLATDTLHVVVDSLQAALGAERMARSRLLMVYTADTLRRSRTEQVNVRLQETIAQLEKPCRVIGRVPCPSRTVSFTGGVLLGSLTVAVLHP